jgi:glycerophosphoryl diester phosphodiesterase
LWGHRGSPVEAPENTLAGIEAAAAAGADGVEIDVRPCRTGELVVLHDPTLARMTGGRDDRPVAKVPYDELCRLDLGDGQRPPLLGEVLDACRARHLRVNVEIKSDVPSRGLAAATTAKELRDHDVTHPVLVSSFDPYVLARFRAVAPSIPVALITERRRPALGGLAVAVALGAYAIHPDAAAATRQSLRWWHRAGLRVQPWTVNDPDAARRLIDLGVDGIITDDPALLRRHMVPRLGSPTDSRRTAGGRRRVPVG